METTSTGAKFKTDKDVDEASAESSLQSSLVKLNNTNGQKVHNSKISKKHESRRRKSHSKPRRIRQIDSDLALESNEADVSKGKSLDCVLQRVLKAKIVEEQREKKISLDQDKTMLAMHETLASAHHHGSNAVRVSTASPGSVESSGSLYSNERADDNLSDNCGAPHSPESFVKTPPQTDRNTALDGPLCYAADTSLQRSLSADEVERMRSISPVHGTSDKELEGAGSILRRGLHMQRSFSSSSSPHLPSAPYNPATATALAAGMGLPTMISNSVASAMPTLLSQHFYREKAGFVERKTSTEEQDTQQIKGVFPTSARGIIGSKMSSRQSAGTPPPEDRAQYKRPPHTYPALIASAILDSPGHLITLRSIYDYIMNHFPYYKYCHDKSAWQNSIRHNLSLNQCFIKVPRYENAAKSNYWTMTREGFEEFGSENSFKRRRRRGAALAPISAYKAMKAKKYQSEGTKNGAKPKTDGSRLLSSSSPASTGVTVSNVGYSMPFPSQLMGLAAGGAWGQRNGFQSEETLARSRKRSQSPPDSEGNKHPRMMVLKSGDGPSLGSANGEEPKRPNSLSSVEEMQGTLNSFSKTLLDSSMLSKTSRGSDIASQFLVTSAQPWLTAAQKNLIATSGMMTSPLVSKDRLPSPSGKNGRVFEDGYVNSESPIIMEGVEVGSEVTIRYEASDMPIRHFRCGFCHYTYVSTSGAMLEQHVRMIHQADVASAKMKIVTQNQSDKSAENGKTKEPAERLMSLQNMVSGLSPRSMMANAQNFLAAVQVSGNNGVSSFPYSGNYSSGLMDEVVMRSLSEQVNAGQSTQSNTDHESSIPNIDAYTAYQRQQALSNALQQATIASTSAASQDQLRMFYQQLALHPFLANQTNATFATTAFPRQISNSESDQSSQFKHFWEYQQKFIDQMKALSNENEVARYDSSARRHNEQTDGLTQSTHNSVSPSGNSLSNPDMDSDSKKSIHGWKQCARCDFTAKGDHGLDLHYRKAHAGQDSAVAVNRVEEVKQAATNLNVTNRSEQSSGEKTSLSSYDVKFDQCGSPLVASTFPTPPLSNSPSYVRRHFTPLDLSAVKEEEEVRMRSTASTASSSTQTVASSSRDEQANSRSCQHCDITFGDEMMLALHMSCHDKLDPFKCTICGQTCHEKYYFNVHLLRGLHQTNNSCGKTEQPSSDGANTEIETKSSSRRNSNSSEASAVATPCVRTRSDSSSEVTSYQ